jgi:hypothetical protein
LLGISCHASENKVIVIFTCIALTENGFNSRKDNSAG